MANTTVPILIAAVGVLAIAQIALLALVAWRRHLRYAEKARTFDLIFNLDITRPRLFFEKKALDDPKRMLEKDPSALSEIVPYFNKLEALSIGIRDGFYDEKILHEYMGTVLVRAYRDSQLLIESLRQLANNNRMYINFEAIARRWEDRLR